MIIIIKFYFYFLVIFFQIDEEEAEDNLVLVAVPPTADDAFSKAPLEVQSTIVQSWLAQHREEYNKIITKCSKIIP